MAKFEIPEWAQIIISVHKAVAGNAVSHAGRLQSSRYFVWQEELTEVDPTSDNKHENEVVNGSTDLYTKNEFDPWRLALQAEFNKNPRITWQKTGCSYEPDTGFWHYSWDWVVF